MDKMGPELRQINWDHNPKGRKKHNQENPLKTQWKTISAHCASGSIGQLIDELPNVRLLHSGCHTNDHK
jgi:hypothetical protein